MLKLGILLVQLLTTNSLIPTETSPFFRYSSSGLSRVIVELPGVTDVNEAIGLIGATAELEFRSGIEGKSLEDGKISSGEYEDWQDLGLTGAYFERAMAQIDQSSGSIVRRPQNSLHL